MQYEIKDEDLKTLKSFFDELIKRGLVNSGGQHCLELLLDNLNTKIVESNNILSILKRASKEAEVFVINPVSRFEYLHKEYPYKIEDGSDGYKDMGLTEEEYNLLDHWLEKEEE